MTGGNPSKPQDDNRIVVVNKEGGRVIIEPPLDLNALIDLGNALAEAGYEFEHLAAKTGASS